MSMTDPIADMLTRVRNANSAFKTSAEMPSSKKLVEIARIMKEEGYIEDYAVTEATPQNTLEVVFKYGPRRERTITGHAAHLQAGSARVREEATSCPASWVVSVWPSSRRPRA